MAGKVFIVSGPSGAGKNSVVSQALSRLVGEHDITHIITYTSRPPREGEVDGKDYWFISGEDFKAKQEAGFFLETDEYNGHKYGSPKIDENDLTSGKSFIYIITIEGAKEAAKAFPNATKIWIAPPEMTTLKARLEKRGTESATQIDKRLAQAEEEMKEAHKIRLFEFVLVNDIFDQSVEEFIMLVKKHI